MESKEDDKTAERQVILEGKESVKGVRMKEGRIKGMNMVKKALG